MTRRRLTPDEIALWQEVAGSVDRLHRRAGAPPRPNPAAVSTVLSAW